MKSHHQDDLLPAVQTIAGPLFEASPFDHSDEEPSSHTEVLVAELIWPHKGRQNPIAIARIAEHVGISPRSVKGIVEQLRVTHRMPIGANREEPAGYFWIVDEADQAAAVGPYKAQIISMWRTLRALETKARLRELLGQLRLED